MKTKHTPGPWKVGKTTHHAGSISYTEIHREDNAEFTICSVHTESEEDYSNASLIAAAPELLEACEYVVRWHREHDSGDGELFGLDFVTTCIAAIRKAKGE